MADAPRQRRGRPRSRPPDDAAPVRALDRGLAILDALAEAGPLALRDVAVAAGLAPSTAHRMLETLARRGYVAAEPGGGRYGIGPRALAAGSAYLGGGLSETAHAGMLALRDALGETVNLAVRDGDRALYVHQVEGTHAVRLFTRVGARVPLHASGVGKALLAWTAAPEREALLARLALTAHTAATLTDPEALRADLARVAERGYALDLEEYETGVRCVAAPLRGAHGVVATISASAPSARFDDARLREVAAAVGACANEVSRRLGWRGV